MRKRLIYSLHAQLAMAERHVTEAEVEAVIKADDRVFQLRTGRWAYEAKVNGEWITVIRRPNGTVHTVVLGRGVRPERILRRP